MLRYVIATDGGGAAQVYTHQHGLGAAPDWAHANSRTSTAGWMASLGNAPYTATLLNVMVHNAQAVHYTAIAVLWQGRSY